MTVILAFLIVMKMTLHLFFCAQLHKTLSWPGLRWRIKVLCQFGATPAHFCASLSSSCFFLCSFLSSFFLSFLSSFFLSSLSFLLSSSSFLSSFFFLSEGFFLSLFGLVLREGEQDEPLEEQLS